MHPLSAYPLHTMVIQRETERKERKKKRTTSKLSRTVHWHSNRFYRKRMSVKKGSDVHLPPSYKTSHPLSVFPLPHSLSASLSYLLNGRQHIGHAVPMRLQQNTTTCLTWDNKSQSHMGTLAEASQPSSAMLTPNLPWLDLHGHKRCGLYLDRQQARKKSSQVLPVQITVGVSISTLAPPVGTQCFHRAGQSRVTAARHTLMFVPHRNIRETCHNDFN